MTVIWGTTPYDGYMGSPLYDGLRSTLTRHTRADVAGCARGRVRGDVRDGGCGDGGVTGVVAWHEAVGIAKTGLIVWCC
jgi:hypothetical protein